MAKTLHLNELTKTELRTHSAAKNADNCQDERICYNKAVVFSMCQRKIPLVQYHIAIRGSLRRNYKSLVRGYGTNSKAKKFR
jgi:hypothetical protein